MRPDLGSSVVAVVLALAVGCAPSPPEPRARPEGLDALAARDGLLPGPAVEEARRVRAIAGEVEAALRRIGGVVDARVLLSLPGLSLRRPPPRAAVVVRYEGDSPPLPASRIQGLVAAAVAGLSADSVEVVWTAERAPPAETLVRVGPVRVARGSRAALLALLGGLATLCLVLSLLLVRRSLVSRRGAPPEWSG